MKVEEYLRNAAECWKLAKHCDNEVQRREFTIIAEAWKRLAGDCGRRIGTTNPNDAEVSPRTESEVIDLISGKPRRR